MVDELKPSALSDDVWSHVVDALAAAVVLDATGRAALDPTLVVQALKDAYGLDEHGMPTLRSLLGFKPTPWIGDANVGVPNLASNDFRVVGDARLGYQGKLFGVVAHGGIKEFDLDQGGVVTQDSHYFGGADASFLFGGERDKLRVEARLTTLVDYVDTTVLSNSVTTGGANFQDYDSTLLRGGAALGLRIAPAERFVARVSAGAGVQFETHDTTSYFQNNSFESVATVSGRYTGGLLAAYRFWPGVLGVRARGSLDYYHLTIDRLTYDFMSQPMLERPGKLPARSFGAPVSGSRRHQLHRLRARSLRRRRLPVTHRRRPNRHGQHAQRRRRFDAQKRLNATLEFQGLGRAVNARSSKHTYSAQ